jgi:hypothetical protein
VQHPHPSVCVVHMHACLLSPVLFDFRKSSSWAGTHRLLSVCGCTHVRLAPHAYRLVHCICCADLLRCCRTARIYASFPCFRHHPTHVAFSTVLHGCTVQPSALLQACGGWAQHVAGRSCGFCSYQPLALWHGAVCPWFCSITRDSFVEVCVCLSCDRTVHASCTVQVTSRLSSAGACYLHLIFVSVHEQAEQRLLC